MFVINAPVFFKSIEDSINGIRYLELNFLAICAFASLASMVRIARSRVGFPQDEDISRADYSAIPDNRKAKKLVYALKRKRILSMYAASSIYCFYIIDVGRFGKFMMISASRKVPYRNVLPMRAIELFSYMRFIQRLNLRDSL